MGERDAMERLIIFGLQAKLLNTNRPVPTLEHYKNAAAKSKDEEATKDEPLDDGKEYFEMDLLVNPQQLVQLSVSVRATARC